MRTGKERRLDMERHHDGMIKGNTSERAKRWFKRPAYSVRGDTSGQVNSNRVQKYERRN